MNAHRSPTSAEAGSAYIITLLALVVLTILALSLALVTQTEVQVGSNERTVNRTFYAADSGLGIAAAEALASGRYTSTTVILNKISVGLGGSSAANVADRVTISALVPIQTVRCDWCPANANGVPSSGRSTTPSPRPRSGSPGPAPAILRPTRRCSGRRP
jgi:hypothetical protein